MRGLSRIATSRVLLAICVITAGGGCASTPAPTLDPIYTAPSSPEELLPGPQLRGLAFDARGADFTDWVAGFEKTVHHNWVVPTYFGYGGQVEFGLLVEHNGTLTAIEVLESTASERLRQAAREALAKSRFGPLPEGLDRLRIPMRVTCVYGPPPGE